MTGAAGSSSAKSTVSGVATNTTVGGVASSSPARRTPARRRYSRISSPPKRSIEPSGWWVRRYVWTLRRGVSISSSAIGRPARGPDLLEHLARSGLHVDILTGTVHKRAVDVEHEGAHVVKSHGATPPATRPSAP